MPKYVIVPVASVGCGKSTVGKTLASVCGFGQVQNDDITGTNRRPKFLQAILEQLESHQVVYADRNNSSVKERKELVDGLRKELGNEVDMVGLQFVHNQQTIPALKKITQERVFARKDHQTVSTATLAPQKIYMIMGGFIKRLEPFTDAEKKEYKLIVDLPVEKDNTADNVLRLLEKIKDNSATAPMLEDTKYTDQEVRDTVQNLIVSETKSEEVLQKEKEEREKNRKRKPADKSKGPRKKQPKLTFNKGAKKDLDKSSGA
ncbi:tRNA ligase kinase domain-domain-containing protein [Yarrowia lipolytica]|jgi:tRNA ligase|uniref:tRNA ligase kinase domain-domain-containing protein n=1 Tax=Yarrowia lipolytica TaxID=4952 RepID=A0A371CBY6_YARLL|nr:tRNA ligase kinase domain-domain-containing protein [Yarrowia lipolytica]RDW35319.1 tRNA ligase kinase domain-domain-containing protein [Yarrowia lipolytica]RDW36832.1 tRNA ligase kinase domain-domain-containing protein [Yarrowia lipolytica]RDW44402.1 tRNA ligase kinase domain-domain-containing protein [Yarrowia lipolytica]RDW51331.1 tRNA ligase kinase domain-domain-containing protein [Yarrowia lipolytica]